MFQQHTPLLASFISPCEKGQNSLKLNNSEYTDKLNKAPAFKKQLRIIEKTKKALPHNFNEIIQNKLNKAIQKSQQTEKQFIAGKDVLANFIKTLKNINIKNSKENINYKEKGIEDTLKKLVKENKDKNIYKNQLEGLNRKALLLETIINNAKQNTHVHINSKSRENLKLAATKSKKADIVVIDLRDKGDFAINRKLKHNQEKQKIKRILVKAKSLDLKNTEIKKVKIFSRVTTDNKGDSTGAQNIDKSFPAQKKTTYLSHLKETLHSEMIKRTGIILRNGGNGEIRLVLKPETLGSLRIKINIQDNNIVGKIIVENNIIKKIVEENLTHLANSFKEEGFSEALINVFVGSDRSEQKQEADSKSTLSKELASKEFEKEVFFIDDIINQEMLVNIIL